MEEEVDKIWFLEQIRRIFEKYDDKGNAQSIYESVAKQAIAYFHLKKPDKLVLFNCGGSLKKVNEEIKLMGLKGKLFHGYYAIVCTSETDINLIRVTFGQYKQEIVNV